MAMMIGIPRESSAGETRVAATPESTEKLRKMGFSVSVESGAGVAAGFTDAAYEAAGARVSDRPGVLASDIVLQVNAPDSAEIAALSPGQMVVGFIRPAQNPQLLEALRSRGVTALAMDMVPRISRAQALDALSSTANISGYRAVIEAAHHFGRFFSGQVTAAGKVPPARVLVIGAGVAGLAAVGAAHSLGAVVKAFDTRPEVADQVRSMGGEFLDLDFQEDGGTADGYAKVMSPEYIRAEMDLFSREAKVTDIIITTAAIPGKRSPRLVTRAMVESMKPGSVIVDLAAAGGGNCELTVPGEVTVTANGVRIIGYTDLAARLPGQSSQLYAQNLVNLMKLLCPDNDGAVRLDFGDAILRSMTVCRDGESTFPPPKVSVSAAPPAAKAPARPVPASKKEMPLAARLALVASVLLACLLIGWFAPAKFLPHFSVFVLSVVIGFYVVWNVTHSLHTPLMSVTNAISGIIVVGAILQIGSDNLLVAALAFIGVLIASVNIFGGFAVTRRMLSMFRRER